MRKKNDTTVDIVEEKAPEKIIEEISPWTIGNEYAVRQDLYVWKDAGDNKKDYDDLPDKLKDRCLQDEFGKAIINAGVRVSIEDVKKVKDTFWAKINGGWICGKNPKTTYIS